MRVRPSVPATCAALALLAAAAAPALADPPAAAPVGTATSAVDLLQVTAAGHVLTAGRLALDTGTTGPVPVSRVVLTPVLADGVPYGQQTLAAEADRSVPSASSDTLVPALTGIAGVTSPAVSVAAHVVAGAPSTTAGTTSLGSLSVLGLPVALQGQLQTASSVVDGSAVSTKTLELSHLVLPSVAELLGALGLDLAKLPVSTLAGLVGQLGLATDAVGTAQAALDAAQAAAQAKTDAATAAADRAAATLAQAVAQRDAAQAALAALSGAAGTGAPAAAPVLAPVNAAPPLPGALGRAPAPASPITGVLPALPGGGAPATTAAAQAALAAAQSLVSTAQGTVDAAQAALALLQDALAPQLRTLKDALVGALHGTPLVALDGLSLATRSESAGAGAGQQTATVVGGEVDGLRVLGKDVLQSALGTPSVDASTLTQPVLDQISGAAAQVTTVLSSVLSAVPGVPALKVPAPSVSLVSRSATTGVEDGFGVARTTISGLRILLPALTLPTSVALPGAASLPGVSTLPAPVSSAPTGGAGVRAAAAPTDVLQTSPVTLTIGDLSDAATYRAASSAPVSAVPVTGTVGPQPARAPQAAPVAAAAPAGVPASAVPSALTSLPRTGSSTALAVLASGLLIGSAWLRRRRAA